MQDIEESVNDMLNELTMSDRVTLLLSSPEYENILAKLLCKYRISNNYLIRELLMTVCIVANITPLIKINIATTIDYCECILYCCRDLTPEYKLPLAVVLQHLLYCTKTFRLSEQIIETLLWVCTTYIDDNQPHSFTHSSHILKFIDQCPEMVESQLRLAYFKYPRHVITFRILCSQKLLKTHPDVVTTQLVVWCTDSELASHIRADAADLLLNHNPHDEMASQLIIALGQQTHQGFQSVYTNSQNAHTSSITESCVKTVNFIISLKIAANDMDFEKIKTKILRDRPDLELCCSRIALDHTLYGDAQTKLVTVFTKLVAFIETHEMRELLESRLFEEMTDMQHTCSTGYITRLANVLSGIIVGYGIQLSYKDEIFAKMKQYLQSRLQKEPLMDTILEEMIAPIYAKKTNFLRFIAKVIDSCRSQLYSEKPDEISDNEFEIVFKIALIHVARM